MAEPEERDLAGEATEMEAYRRRLRADISPEEAAEECADRDDLMDDPDEYREGCK